MFKHYYLVSLFYWKVNVCLSFFASKWFFISLWVYQSLEMKKCISTLCKGEDNLLRVTYNFRFPRHIKCSSCKSQSLIWFFNDPSVFFYTLAASPTHGLWQTLNTDYRYFPPTAFCPLGGAIEGCVICLHWKLQVRKSSPRITQNSFFWFILVTKVASF